MTNQIRELRKLKGWTQERLAEAIGRDVTTINKLEKGRMGLTLEYMIQIAEVLGCDPRALIPDADNSHVQPKVPVVGFINPGAWSEEGAIVAPEPNELAVARHQRYRDVEHFAFESVIRDPSNERPPVKHYLVCIPLEDVDILDLELADAVVERRYKHLVSYEMRKIEYTVLAPPKDEIESEDKVLGVVVITVEPLISQASHAA